MQRQTRLFAEHRQIASLMPKFTMENFEHQLLRIGFQFGASISCVFKKKKLEHPLITVTPESQHVEGKSC